MPFEFIQIPANGQGSAKEELNKLLRGGRIASVRKEFVANGEDSFWAFCIEFLDGALGGDKSRGSGPKVDYKEVLNAEDFAVFAKLRDLPARSHGFRRRVMETNRALAIGHVPGAPGRQLALLRVQLPRCVPQPQRAGRLELQLRVPRGSQLRPSAPDSAAMSTGLNRPPSRSRPHAGRDKTTSLPPGAGSAADAVSTAPGGNFLTVTIDPHHASPSDP
jgi:hypothetical protein